ncbi:diaminopimelate decarboxylase [Chloroflexota bacterium]
MNMEVPRLKLFPVTAGISSEGHLELGGCDAVNMAGQFGTPLYVFDETTIREQCRLYQGEFSSHYPEVTVLYACKAFSNMAVLQIIRDEGLGLDAVSGGELAVARAAGFPLERVFLHGNNKSDAELGLALDWGVGRVVVDNLDELGRLATLTLGKKQSVDILLRLSPGIDPHTHKYNTTGIVDSKFGLARFNWETAVKQAMDASYLNLTGIHIHLGSSLFETQPYLDGIGVVLDFAAKLKQELSFTLKEFDIGGGFAAQYEIAKPAPPTTEFAVAVTTAVKDGCAERGLDLPRLIIEPGRSIVCRAGVALYTAGVVKDIPGVRRYVSVDGGMGDNIRYALYGARHEAILANKPQAEATTMVTISGKYCESGDVIISDIVMPEITRGDIISVPDCGAYCLPMASNYNAALKPAVVMVNQGKARLIRSRESFEDLTRHDMV